jgi:hypothetical protein
MLPYIRVFINVISAARHTFIYIRENSKFNKIPGKIIFSQASYLGMPLIFLHGYVLAL